MPNVTEADYRKMNIDQSFKAYQRDDLKVIYKIKLDDEDYIYDRHIITKILKMDENNQYDIVITNPMPTGCIKEHPAPTWSIFNFLLESFDLCDPIGHLYIVEIEFNEKDGTKREHMYNEILLPTIEKQKFLEANKRSIDLFSKTTDGKPKSYCCTAKSHATLLPKKFIPLCLEDLTFLIMRCCWKVTKTYSHYTFEQSCFKRDFVLMNQRSRHNAENANFGYDCRNNVNNGKFGSIIDDINEISYIKKYYNLFDNKVSNFVNSGILERQIERNFQQQIANVRHDDSFRTAKITSTKNQVKDERDKK